MSSGPALPLRLLRRGLQSATRAGSAALERMLRRDDPPPPFVAPPAAPRPRGARGGEARVRFGALDLEVPRGTTLLEAAGRARVDLRSYCGGNCSCGTCRVEVPERSRRGLSPMSGLEAMVLGAEAADRGDRLACQAQVLGDVDVVIPEWF